MSAEKEIEKSSHSNGLDLSSEKIQTSIKKGDTHLVYDAGARTDGTKAHPQPTNDPLDPLNWSTMQKHVILAIVMLK